MATSRFTREVSSRSPQDGVMAWREVGWIFREGEVLTIERRRQHSRARSAEI
jgi:hypothetical protein